MDRAGGRPRSSPPAVRARGEEAPAADAGGGTAIAVNTDNAVKVEWVRGMKRNDVFGVAVLLGTILACLAIAWYAQQAINTVSVPTHTGVGFVVMAMVRNEQRVLPRMLQSVRDTLPQARIFLCDTGSTDDTIAVAERYGGDALLKPVFRSALNWTNFEVGARALLSRSRALTRARGN